MVSFKKSGLAAVLTVMLVCIAALPLSHAQSSRSAPYVLQWNSSGSDSYLGITMDDVTASNMSKYKLTGERGVIVRSVQSGSPASAANLKEDDVILEYAGEKVWSASQFSRLVQETPSGRKVDLGVSRDGKRVNLTAQIGTRDTRRSDGRMGDIPEQYGQLFRDFPFRQNPDTRSYSTIVTPAKPRLGVTLEPLTDQLAESL